MQNPPTRGSDSPEPSKGVWKVGTITYTTGGVVVLFLWLLWGDFAWSMRDRSVVGLASWYLNSLKIPNFVFAILMSSFPAVVSLLLGPIISMKSDRHRGKLGRRIPFLLLTTPVAALGMIGLGITPFIAKWIHSITQVGTPTGDSLRHFFKDSSLGMSALGLLDNEMIVALVCFGVFWAAFEFATIAGLAVFGGLINDVVPQKLLGRFYGLFRAISLIDGMIFNYWIMGHVPEHFTLIIISIGVFYGIAFTWVCLKVKEGDYPPPPPLDPSHNTVIKSFFGGVKVYFKECFSNSYYILIFIMIIHHEFSATQYFCNPLRQEHGHRYGYLWEIPRFDLHDLPCPRVSIGLARRQISSLASLHGSARRIYHRLSRWIHIRHHDFRLSFHMGFTWRFIGMLSHECGIDRAAFVSEAEICTVCLGRAALCRSASHDTGTFGWRCDRQHGKFVSLYLRRRSSVSEYRTFYIMVGLSPISKIRRA